jgi:hypothetical protein
MRIGYADNLNDVISDVDKMYNDDVTKKQYKRPNLKLLLASLKSDDTLVVKNLGHLSWGIKNVLALLLRLLRNNIDVYISDYNEKLSDHKIILEMLNDCNIRKLYKMNQNVKRKENSNKIKVDTRLWDAYYAMHQKKLIKKPEMAKQLGLTLPTFYRHFATYKRSISN